MKLKLLHDPLFILPAISKLSLLFCYITFETIQFTVNATVKLEQNKTKSYIRSKMKSFY